MWTAFFIRIWWVCFRVRSACGGIRMGAAWRGDAGAEAPAAAAWWRRPLPPKTTRGRRPRGRSGRRAGRAAAPRLRPPPTKGRRVIRPARCHCRCPRAAASCRLRCVRLVVAVWNYIMYLSVFHKKNNQFWKIYGLQTHNARFITLSTRVIKSIFYIEKKCF